MTAAKAALESPINESPLLVDDVAMEPPKRVDLSAHQGLRGLLSLYVMIYHYFWYSTLQWELHGSALMPPFFVLSGFSLAVGYGSKPLAPGSACCGEAADGDRALDWRAFYRNRAARILPTHYLMNAASVPLSFLGYGLVSKNALVSAGVLTAVCATTWFGPNFGSFCAPSWTISTLCGFYLVFPWVAPRLQRAAGSPPWYAVLGLGMPAGCCRVPEPPAEADATSLAVHMRLCFWAQLFSAAWSIGLGIATGMVGPMATMWAVPRFPVFLAGAYAGLLALRGGPVAVADAGLTARLYRCGTWASVADRSAFAVAFQLAALSVVAITVTDVYAALWLQLTLPDTWVALVLGLALDDASRTYRMLTTPAMLFFGKISMTLYLVHLPVMQYFTFFLRGAQPNGWRGDVWATCVSDDYDDDEQEDCEDAMRRFSRRRLIPPWSIAPLAVLSIVLAVALEKFFEAPRSGTRLSASSWPSGSRISRNSSKA